ncbi:MAG: hypothetical protein KJZ86_20440 [Caldilineaceae bacterium]|nr:hypothetical protein [Caldilineaceae bacterium]
MRALFVDFFVWYLVVQLIALAALPLCLRLFVNLPDRGYAFAKSLGILLVGGLLWLGNSYGLLRNEAGGAWLAFGLMAGLSLAAGGREVARIWQERRLPFAGGWRYLLGVEALFFAAFLLWTFVRAYDPAINHTEQPMDLMFINGIWTSPTFPPRDPWLAGYAISYYYFGYWLLTTLIHLTGQTPEVAYNLGQACWFGLLLLGSFGVGYNLLATSESPIPNPQYPGRLNGLRISYSVLAGLLSAVAVGVTGNLQGVLEWLYAQGVNIDGLARFFAVRNFPAEARVTNLWHIDSGWWWWRSSRVLADRTLLGDHIEVIDEFPIFSYILGDNHPHVLAMPFVLLVVALALNLFLGIGDRGVGTGDRGTGKVGERLRNTPYAIRDLLALIPLQSAGLLLLVGAAGGLIFFNTWDFPPYWLLLTLSLWWVGKASYGVGRAFWLAAGLAGILLAGALVVYFPYFLSAQSQAGGVLPNFFNPTHLPQFLLMFGHFLLGAGSLLLLAWRENPPSLRILAASAGIVWGLPLLFLVGMLLIASNSEAGRTLLQRMPLAPEMTSYPAAIAERWLARPWTFLLVGGLAALALALLWQRFTDEKSSPSPATGEDRRGASATTFALLLAGIGLLLLFAPEFVYLRDNFGSRMNTVFKFYYQGWLLLGLAAVYGAVRSVRMGWSTRWPVVPLLGGLSLLLILAGLVYPVAGVYTKANFFRGEPTLNGLAYVGPDELAVIDWLRANTPPDALVLEGKGGSYRADTARLSAATGRATLLGWDGHESQWRGDAYGEMAQGRPEALEGVYRNSSAEQLRGVLEQWQIAYVLVGPAERAQYGIPPGVEDRLGRVMELVFQSGEFLVYRQRR